RTVATYHAYGRRGQGGLGSPRTAASAAPSRNPACTTLLVFIACPGNSFNRSDQSDTCCSKYQIMIPSHQSRRSQGGVMRKLSWLVAVSCLLVFGSFGSIAAA